MTIEEKDFHILDSEAKVKWITGTDYTVELPKEFGDHARLKRWCLENCTEPVAFIEYAIGGGGMAYFYENADAVAFKLRWVE